jgi:diketogulonate reductase-like aldo/keto reductase
MEVSKVEHFLNLTLRDLDIDYVDLYLVHWPVAVQYVKDTEFVPKDASGGIAVDKSTDLEAIWKAMEAQVDAKRAKAIGISNFNAKQVERIVKVARIQPANQQVIKKIWFDMYVFGPHQSTFCIYLLWNCEG